MTPIRLWQPYPANRIDVIPFQADLPALFDPPQGVEDSLWPPTQMEYLGSYLQTLGCKTIVVESHYIDRDYISDLALFYARSLRAYGNYCHRLHFFKDQFDFSQWQHLVVDVGAAGEAHGASNARLQASYLGFCVLRPLPGSPVGRTVLPPLREPAITGECLDFCPIRDYRVHLSRFELNVRGLAFQQQDQGVSACASTALWSSINGIASLEGLSVPTPGEITQSASRYLLEGGRPLPSEGLTVLQICEAVRASGLAPLIVPSIGFEEDRAQLSSYLRSGFAPVLAIQSIDERGGHAVCAVGTKRGEVVPQTNPDLHFRDASTSLRGLYLHDDRLGPYAPAGIYPWTSNNGSVRTALRITWPDNRDVEFDHAVLSSFVVPVPIKLRLTVTRMRELGLQFSDAAGRLFPEFEKTMTLATKYVKGTNYRAEAASFGLSEAGLYELTCELALSRYVGLIEIGIPDGPFFDVLIDATETNANPAQLAWVKRQMLPAEKEAGWSAVAKRFGARFIR